MNICFLTGEIIQEIEFNFLYNSQNISVAKTEIKLQNKTVISIYAYNELADELYAYRSIGDTIFIEGVLINKNETLYVQLLQK